LALRSLAASAEVDAGALEFGSAESAEDSASGNDGEEGDSVMMPIAIRNSEFNLNPYQFYREFRVMRMWDGSVAIYLLALLKTSGKSNTYGSG
jgi:hypothetical protein